MPTVSSLHRLKMVSPPKAEDMGGGGKIHEEGVHEGIHCSDLLAATLTIMEVLVLNKHVSAFLECSDRVSLYCY